MLWRLPTIVPIVHTAPNVILKLQSGADLMTPGLTNPPFDKRAKKGAIVAVADMEEETVPIAVGTAEIDISALRAVQGVKGHAVRIQHWLGDELWAYSPSGKPGVDPPDELEPTWKDQIQELNDARELAEKTADMKLEDESEEQGGVKLEARTADAVDGKERTKEEEVAETEPEREFSTKEIDEAFRNAFLYGVRHQMRTNPDAKNFGLDFPLQQSWVLSSLVQPFLPAFTPQQASQLQIKKTSYKNVKKFIRSLDKEKIIKSKERDGNEVVIFDIDFEDPAIVDFTPYRLPKKETAAGTALGRGTKATEVAQPNGGDSAIGQTLKIVTLYKPKEKYAPLFEPSNSDSHALYSAAELGVITNSYIEAENLVKETNKRLVSLNPFLANTVFNSNSALDKEVQSRRSVQRDTLSKRIIDGCTLYYHIIRNDDASSKPKSGLPPKINILLETRTGSKTVTKVSGLEPFFIAPQPLADELRKACAGSTSVERLQGSSPKNPVMEVMVQGPQKDAVAKALVKRGIDVRWIEVTDKTKKKKR
jgi:translation initiation factor 2D